MIHKGSVVKVIQLSRSDTTMETRFRLAQMVRKAFAVSARRTVESQSAVEDSPKVDDPYSILGASPQDSDDEIKRKYKKLIADYHPDRVANLGIELRDLAERKTKAINNAYAAIRRLRRPPRDVPGN
jgi:preprotein translocase subunit Sec63